MTDGPAQLELRGIMYPPPYCPNDSNVRRAVLTLIQTEPWLEGEAFATEDVARSVGYAVGYVRSNLELLEQEGILESETAKFGAYLLWRLSAARIRELGIER
jgi:hypothetical protein